MITVLDITPKLRAKRSHFLALTQDFSLKKKREKEALRQACAPLLVEESHSEIKFTTPVFGNCTIAHRE